MRNLYFKDICNYLKKDNAKIVKTVDALCGIGILLSPVVMGPAALPLLGYISTKNEITKIGNMLIDDIVSRVKNIDDKHSRMQKMEIAYGLICFTTFFDAIDKNMPDSIQAKIKQLLDKKEFIKEFQLDCNKDNTEKNLPLTTPKSSQINVLALFPVPTALFSDTKEKLRIEYCKLSKNLDTFIKSLPIYENNGDRISSDLRAFIDNLPGYAIQCFQDDYFSLATNFDEFWIWSQISQDEIRDKQFSEFVNKYISLLEKNDIGFSNMNDALKSMPKMITDSILSDNANEIAISLERHYNSLIDEPVIEDKDLPDDSNKLIYPKISEAFITQSYRALQYTSKDMHLEFEKSWSELEVKDDLEAFFVRYLCSPCSVDAPLLILGHPGSGKSLLTKIIASKIMCDAYTTIRIPLREVNAEDPIELLVEKQIEKDTQERIISWATFANQFKEKPLVIILDGFDELLQASGAVFSNYLEKVVLRFQQEQYVQNRPIRLIVTSRITLIDKTTIPLGTMVLRLSEFNEQQRDRWISIWNDTNAKYFETSNIEPFELPRAKELKYSKILELAEQPLLLLMLAIYDSLDNGLKKEASLSRTVLYDSLLRRFILRERRRYINDFDNLLPNQKKLEIDKEMKRLGIAAIGMYNRRKLHLLSSELDIDLSFFEQERKFIAKNNRPLSESELLIGSFFFIHKSMAGEENNCDTAFEFLHNTFGEFLTADFIMQLAKQEASSIQRLLDPAFTQELRQKLNNPDLFSNEWYASIMSVPLYTRPVILEMLREWFNQSFEPTEKQLFLQSFDKIVNSHINMILTSRTFPQIMKNASLSYSNFPLLEYLSIYSLNLIILRTIFSGGVFQFDETCYNTISSESNSEPRPWDKLVAIWRMWIKVEALSGLYDILISERDGDKINLSCRKDFLSYTKSNKIENIYYVAETLSDNVMFSLSGLFITDTPSEFNRIQLYENKLISEDITISFEFILRKLHLSAGGYTSNIEIEKLIFEGTKHLNRSSITANQAISFFDLLIKLINCDAISDKLLHYIDKIISQEQTLLEMSELAPLGMAELFYTVSTKKDILDKRYSRDKVRLTELLIERLITKEDVEQQPLFVPVVCKLLKFYSSNTEEVGTQKLYYKLLSTDSVFFYMHSNYINELKKIIQILMLSKDFTKVTGIFEKATGDIVKLPVNFNNILKVTEFLCFLYEYRLAKASIYSAANHLLDIIVQLSENEKYTYILDKKYTAVKRKKGKHFHPSYYMDESTLYQAYLAAIMLVTTFMDNKVALHNDVYNLLYSTKFMKNVIIYNPEYVADLIILHKKYKGENLFKVFLSNLLNTESENQFNYMNNASKYAIIKIAHYSCVLNPNLIIDIKILFKYIKIDSVYDISILYLKDIKWYAEQTNNKRLLQQLNEF